jgi:hypothetical protein
MSLGSGVVRRGGQEQVCLSSLLLEAAATAVSVQPLDVLREL